MLGIVDAVPYHDKRVRQGHRGFVQKDFVGSARGQTIFLPTCFVCAKPSGIGSVTHCLAGRNNASSGRRRLRYSSNTPITPSLSITRSGPSRTAQQNVFTRSHRPRRFAVVTDQPQASRSTLRAGHRAASHVTIHTSPWSPTSRKHHARCFGLVTDQPFASRSTLRAGPGPRTTILCELTV